MSTDFKILSKADSAVNLQQIVIEDATIPQMPSYSAL